MKRKTTIPWWLWAIGAVLVGIILAVALPPLIFSGLLFYACVVDNNCI